MKPFLAISFFANASSTRTGEAMPRPGVVETGGSPAPEGLVVRPSTLAGCGGLDALMGGSARRRGRWARSGEGTEGEEGGEG